MEYLKEFIKDNEEALEFWDAINGEFKDLDDEIKSLNIENSELRYEVIDLANEIEDQTIETIDCGIGVIEFKNPENMKLQSFMEDLKEKLEHRAKFGVLPETIEL